MKRAYCVRWPYEPRYIASNGQDEATCAHDPYRTLPADCWDVQECEQ